jgi:hypothetical protein
MKTRVLLWSGIVFIFLCVTWALDRHFSKKEEGFTTLSGTTVEERIMRIYEFVLQRVPSSKELIDASRNIVDGVWTELGLRQRLMDSEEYQRMIKVQSNGLTPELPKVISDRELIKHIAKIYQEERKETIPLNMILPIKDIYIALDYNEYALRAFLRSDKYVYFAEDVRMTKDVEKEAVILLVQKHMGGVEAVTEKGKALAIEEAAKAQAIASASNPSYGSGAVIGRADLHGVAPTDTVPRTIHDMDGDLSPQIDNIVQKCQRLFSKDEVAKLLDRQYNETFHLPVRQHYGNMVLRPEMSWSVPQQAPPVCTTLGKNPITQPMMTPSKLLLGTPLDEAAGDTAVGSILPPFEYKEYIPLLIKKEPHES